MSKQRVGREPRDREPGDRQVLEVERDLVEGVEVLPGSNPFESEQDRVGTAAEVDPANRRMQKRKKLLSRRTATGTAAPCLLRVTTGSLGLFSLCILVTATSSACEGGER